MAASAPATRPYRGRRRTRPTTLDLGAELLGSHNAQHPELDLARLLFRAGGRLELVVEADLGPRARLSVGAPPIRAILRRLDVVVGRRQPQELDQVRGAERERIDITPRYNVIGGDGVAKGGVYALGILT